LTFLLVFSEYPEWRDDHLSRTSSCDGQDKVSLSNRQVAGRSAREEVADQLTFKKWTSRALFVISQTLTKIRTLTEVSRSRRFQSLQLLNDLWIMRHERSWFVFDAFSAVTSLSRVFVPGFSPKTGFLW
jgi:hypothetical protein